MCCSHRHFPARSWLALRQRTLAFLQLGEHEIQDIVLTKVPPAKFFFGTCISGWVCANVLPTLSLLDQDFHSSLLQSSWGASVMLGSTRNLFDKTASSEMLMSWQKKKTSARRIPVAGEASGLCVVGRERAWLLLLSNIVQKQAELGLCGGLGKILMDLPTILCLLCSRPVRWCVFVSSDARHNLAEVIRVYDIIWYYNSFDYCIYGM